MAVLARNLPIGTGPTRLNSQTHHSGQVSLAFFNNGSVTILVGGPDVTAPTGVPVPAGTWSPGFDLASGDVIYGCVASGVGEARVIESGV